MLQRIGYLVFEGFAVYALALLASARGIPSLNYEA